MPQEPDPTTQSGVPKEEVKNPYRDILEHSRAEIIWVRSAYKLAASLIAIIFTVGIIFTYKDSYDIREEARKNVDRMQKKLDDQLAVLSRTVEDRIDQEFKKENIRNLVEEKVKLRIEEIADPLIQGHIAKSIDPKIRQAEQQIESIKDEVAKVNATVSELKVVSEFITIVTYAKNDDRQAFDKLKTWSDDPNFPFKNEAGQAWIKIRDEHDSPFALSGFTVPWPDGVDPAKFSFENLKEIFRSAPDFARVALVEYIWKTRQDIPKKDKMQFLIDVMKSDKSLRVVEYSARFFKEESKQKTKSLLTDIFVDWWENNKGIYEKDQQKNPSDKQ